MMDRQESVCKLSHYEILSDQSNMAFRQNGATEGYHKCVRAYRYLHFIPAS